MFLGQFWKSIFNQNYIFVLKLAVLNLGMDVLMKCCSI